MTQIPERPPKNRVIWRYMSLDKYLDLLISKSIKFTQVAIAVDKLETMLMHKRLEKSGGFAGREDIQDSARNYIELLKKTHYISCWAGCEHECRNLWNLYTGVSKIGIAIKSTVENFIENVRWESGDCCDGYDYREVTYRDDFTDIAELQNIIKLISTKAKAYTSESEIRFIVSKTPFDIPDVIDSADSSRDLLVEKVKMPKVLSFDIDLDSIADEIWISPYCEDWQFETIRKITGKFNENLTRKIKKSDLEEL